MPCHIFSDESSLVIGKNKCFEASNNQKLRTKKLIDCVQGHSLSFIPYPKLTLL